MKKAVLLVLVAIFTTTGTFVPGVLAEKSNAAGLLADGA